MYCWVITTERDWMGPYLSERAEDVKDSLDAPAEIFDSDYSDLAKAKQEYRERHPEWRRRNFKVG